MAKEKDDKKKEEKKPSKSPEQIEAEKAAKAAKKAEHAAKAKSEGKGGEGEAPAEESGGGGKGKGKKGGGGAKKGEEAIPFPKDYLPRLRKKYNEQIAAAIATELGIKNKMAVPKVEKIVISMGLGKAIAEKPASKRPSRNSPRSPARRP